MIDIDPIIESTNNEEHITDIEELRKLKKFNWGAFFMTWIWCIAHGKWTWLAIFIVLGFTSKLADTAGNLLVSSISNIAILVSSIMLGGKANQYAWENKGHIFGSIDKTHKAQRKWLYWGIAYTIILICLYILAVLYAN